MFAGRGDSILYGSASPIGPVILRILHAFAGIALMLAGLPAAAQNTAGVFGPVVNEGHRSMQYRAAHDLDSYGLAQRFHYQHALNGDLMIRGILQAVKNVDSDVDVDFFQGELFWQLDDLSENWRHGLRFDARLRTEGRTGLVGLNWTNQFDLGDRWMARLIVGAGAEVGDGASGKVALQTRANVTYSTDRRISTGLEMFSVYGLLGDLPSFNRQFHQAGPTLSVPFGDGWGLFSSVLFGLTSATPDTQARLWLIRAF